MSDLWPAPRPLDPVDRVVSLPGSKSLTNRALLLASIADGPSVVHRPLRSRDTLLMAAALTSLGTGIEDTAGDGAGDWAVTPAAWDRDAEVDCGLAGTVMRFVPALRMLDSIEARAPSPSAIITMTEPTPMMMPSAVSDERIALRRRASNDVATTAVIVVRR